MISWGRESIGTFAFFHAPLRHCSRMPRQLDQGRAAKQALQASTPSWAFVSLNSLPLLRNANKRKLSNSIGGGSLYGGGARPYDSGSARRALPYFVALQGRWVNSEGSLESVSVMVQESLLTATERVCGSHPRRVFSAHYELLSPFHDGNTRSAPKTS
jgi:hypothetical protein